MYIKIISHVLCIHIILSHTSGDLCVGRLLFCERLDVVRGKESHLIIHLPLPPLPLLPQHSNHTALVEAQLVC